MRTHTGLGVHFEACVRITTK